MLSDRFSLFLYRRRADELGLCNDLSIFKITTGVYKKINSKIEKKYSYCYKKENEIISSFGETQISNATQKFLKNFPGSENWGPINHKFNNGLHVISGSTTSGNLWNILLYTSYKFEITGKFSDYICNSMYAFYNHLSIIFLGVIILHILKFFTCSLVQNLPVLIKAGFTTIQFNL